MNILQVPLHINSPLRRPIPHGYLLMFGALAILLLSIRRGPFIDLMGVPDRYQPEPPVHILIWIEALCVLTFCLKNAGRHRTFPAMQSRPIVSIRKNRLEIGKKKLFFKPSYTFLSQLFTSKSGKAKGMGETNAMNSPEMRSVGGSYGFRHDISDQAYATTLKIPAR